MAHYAFLDENNIVTFVMPGRNENEIINGISNWEEFYSEDMNQVCKRTSYNTLGNEHKNNGIPFRYNYAGIGYTFDPTKGVDGAFIPQPCHQEATLNDKTCLWECPNEVHTPE
jgi:hypothetical protein